MHDYEKIFEIDGLAELREYLSGRSDVAELRERLYACFLKYSQYRDVAEWNAAVRICEALAIIGWGRHEPLEAVKGTWFNGNPETYFINRDAVPRFLDAVWSGRKDGFAIDCGLSSLHGDAASPSVRRVSPDFRAGAPQDIPLGSQRNWIPKNPVRITRGLANCYDSSRPVIESIENELIPELNRKMRPGLYGSAIDTIVINLSFSFYDNFHCKTNYIIADESLRLKQKDFYPKLLEMYSEKEIDDNGYYLRNRFTYAPFRPSTGTARVSIVLEREFSQMSVREQKLLLGSYLLHALGHVAERLERKISYDFPLMLRDFRFILDSWLKNC